MSFSTTTDCHVTPMPLTFNSLYRTFFKSYTEKVWGIPCNKTQAKWAAQRIKGLSLSKTVINAMFGSNATRTLIKEFDYLVLGSGMMREKCQSLIEEAGSVVSMNTRAFRVECTGMQIDRVIVQKGTKENSETFEVTGDSFVSSMPVSALIRQLDPPATPAVIEAANELKYRDFLIVLIVVNIKSLGSSWQRPLEPTQTQIVSCVGSQTTQLNRA